MLQDGSLPFAGLLNNQLHLRVEWKVFLRLKYSRQLIKLSQSDFIGDVFRVQFLGMPHDQLDHVVQCFEDSNAPKHNVINCNWLLNIIRVHISHTRRIFDNETVLLRAILLNALIELVLLLFRSLWHGCSSRYSNLVPALDWLTCRYVSQKSLAYDMWKVIVIHEY